LVWVKIGQRVPVVRITEDEQEAYDFDWYASDASGVIAHFASAGKELPAIVSESREDLQELHAYFNALPEDSAFTVLETKKDRNLISFETMAARGLYSYDTDPCTDDLLYSCIAKPAQALLVSTLPLKIQRLVERVRLKNGTFEGCLNISNADIGII